MESRKLYCWVSAYNGLPRTQFPVFYPLTTSWPPEKPLPSDIREFEFHKEFLLTPRYFNIENPQAFQAYEEARIQEIKQGLRSFDFFEECCQKKRKEVGNATEMSAVASEVLKDFKKDFLLTQEESQEREIERVKRYREYGFVLSQYGQIYDTEKDQHRPDKKSVFKKEAPNAQLNDKFLVCYFIFDLPTTGLFQTRCADHEVVVCPLYLTDTLNEAKDLCREKSKHYNHCLDVVQPKGFLNPIMAEELKSHYQYESPNQQAVQYWKESQEKKKSQRQVLEKFEEEGIDLPVVEIYPDGQVREVNIDPDMSVDRTKQAQSSERDYLPVNKIVQKEEGE